MSGQGTGGEYREPLPGEDLGHFAVAFNPTRIRQAGVGPRAMTAVERLHELGAHLIRVDRDTCDAPILVARAVDGSYIEIYSDGSHGPWRGGRS